ncbi:hypothetical protein LMG27174_06849 [Paraburkholderia rhynchosiae]|uniref:Uncharacterized protein n=1 Tax=Paraburkholderia rhynchosiae TaxID=487049 RepID=A0A6J5CRD7_9BURK|nr:hypothetical protein LMG27174_06849 [Paraburkholderia rhynchosiae]
MRSCRLTHAARHMLLLVFSPTITTIRSGTDYL